MLEFKLNYYFEKLKDTPIASVSKFKSAFIKKYGDFELLGELSIMIQRYQLRKYGQVLESGTFLNNRDKKNTYNNREVARNLRIFGTKEERQRRRIEEKYARK